MKTVAEMMTTQQWTPTNRFVGVWHRRGYTNDAQGKGKVIDAPNEMYKIFSDKQVLCLWSVDDNLPSMHASGHLWPYQALSETSLQEHHNTCVITWLDADTYSLVWLDDGVPVVEIWDRCGLPQNFQTLCGTNIPIRMIRAVGR